VIEGRKTGRQIGWPTANVETAGLQLPPDGVYESRVIIGGADYRAVANLGIRPTLVNSGTRVLEVHLLDFQGNLYGMNLEVEFLRFLRGEKKFVSLEALKAQIVLDVASVQPR
jgi:riboflavin kinase/FMN adenylyltransferase